MKLGSKKLEDQLAREQFVRAAHRWRELGGRAGGARPEVADAACRLVRVLLDRLGGLAALDGELWDARVDDPDTRRRVLILGTGEEAEI